MLEKMDSQLIILSTSWCDFGSLGKHHITLLLIVSTFCAVTSGQGPIIHVNAILNENTFLPCDMSSLTGTDSATLVLWYKETEENPIYSFDNRGRLSESGSHWKDNVIFGGRAFFRSKTSPTGLSLDNVQELDEGYYRCRVDFDHSPTKNLKIRLNVVVPPSEPNIYDENENNLTEGHTRPYEEGATMTLMCVSRGGRPKPQLQWWREGTLLESKVVTAPMFEDSTSSSASITVTNMNRSHYQTFYSCQAVNNNVTAPASRVVVVNMFLAPLSVTITNNTQQLSAGFTYRIHCQTVGSVPPAKIFWWKDDQQLSHSSEVMSSVYESTNKNISSSVLKFVPTKKDCNTTIKCVASNPNVETWRKETSWVLDITYPPDVKLTLGRELNPNDIREDTDVYFHCEVDSNPPAYKIIWKHNGVHIHQNLKNEIRVNDKSLILRKVKKESIGNYTCEAFNVEGEKESNPVELRVAYKPVCKPDQKPVYGAGRNEDIQVVCEVDSNPEPDSFNWSFNHSQEPIPENRFSIVDKRRGISILTFQPRSEMDFGFLMCSASNRIGKQLVPCHYQIVPAVPPHGPQNCTIGNVTTVSLEVHCNPGFDGGLSQYFLLEVINFTTGSMVLNITAQEPYFKLNRLLPGHSIQVRVYAINVKGRSQPFELEGATLKAEKHTGLPSTLLISPFSGVIICVGTFAIIVVFFIICLTKCNSSSLSKSSRRPTSLCIKEKTHTSLLENHERDEKDPDLIPVKKNTRYQVLRADVQFDDISKSTSAANIQQCVNTNTSDDEQFSFIDCTENLQSLSMVKENNVFSQGENT